MSRWVHVINSSRAGRRLVQARWCSSFLCRLRGLSLRSSLGEDEGLLLVESRPSRANAAIHMGGMRFPLGIIWMDTDGHVVDMRLARPWGIYIPSDPAKYTLEAGPSVLEQVARGDRLVFADA
jgi:uncharacterized membrane protein (UPF0127 family)